MTYSTMAARCGRARSSSWWRNVVEYGPWRGPDGSQTGPPPQNTHRGIARLFDVDEDRLREMIADDWYGVRSAPPEMPTKTARLSPLIEQLADNDMALLEIWVSRLIEGDAAA